MKNNNSNIDPKILEDQLLNEIILSSGENNNVIRELHNNMLNSAGIKSEGPSNLNVSL
jgi:hypothetical protein